MASVMNKKRTAIPCDELNNRFLAGTIVVERDGDGFVLISDKATGQRWWAYGGRDKPADVVAKMIERQGGVVQKKKKLAKEGGGSIRFDRNSSNRPFTSSSSI